MNLKELLKAHVNDVLGEDSFRITARRGHIYKDTVESLRRGFDETKHIRVIFFGEPAVDNGGPRREFFYEPFGRNS